MTTELKASAAEVERFIRDGFPGDADAAALKVTALEPERAELRLVVHERHLRPGRTVSGPTLMKLADTVAFALLLGRAGLDVPMATASMNVHFLRRPEPGDLHAEARMLRWGRTTSVVEIDIFSGGGEAPVARAIATWRLAQGESLP